MNKYICIFCAVLTINSSTYADTSSDTNRIFDWAESTFPTIFSTHETTKSIQLPENANELAGSWLYRLYPEQNVYAGVLNEKDVYVLGGPWSQLLFVGTLNNLVANLPPTNTTVSGTCVDRVTLVAAGTQYNTLSASADSQSSSEFHVTHEEVTNTLIRVKTTPTSDSFVFKSAESITEYRHNSGFVYVSKLTINNQFDNSVTSTEVSFSPERQSIQSPACVGQTIIRDYVLTINDTRDGVALPTRTEQSPIVTHTVEAVNESKSVTSGTFNTVRFRNTNSNGSYNLEWYDIVTGISIAIETYTENGLLKSTLEVISLTKP